MPADQPGDSSLHYTILKFIIEHGYAPGFDELGQLLNTSEEQLLAALRHLEQSHGLVLHPDRRSIWVIHPFSTAPTNFLVRASDMEWWGNCAWCSLGLAALVNRDVTIATVLGANDRQVEIHITRGELIETNFLVHFPIPMAHAWDNVIYTCSTMLLFETERAIDDWCRKHRIPKGDVQPIARVWEFARVWYGNHLNPKWTKWTADEARAIFARFGMTGRIWEIPGSAQRF
jgi:hypothetical protein